MKRPNTTIRRSKAENKKNILKKCPVGYNKGGISWFEIHKKQCFLSSDSNGQSQTNENRDNLKPDHIQKNYA